jgi:hypothetical protein
MNGKRFFKSALAASATSVLFLVLCLSLPPSRAEEVRYPVPSYEGETLERVKQWEKTWAGKKIDPTNIDEVKEFVPESFYDIIKDPETWGEVWFEIVPYRQILPTKGDLEFTKKYAGTCTIDADDKLQNYVSGIPFPNPKTALEIAYNYDSLNEGDNAHAYEDLWITDGKKRYDRKMVLDAWFLYFSGRREVPPVPELPNPKGIYRATHVEHYEPASMRGTRSVMIKWKDRTKPFESYTFSSSTRKVIRKSTAQRTSTQGASDGAGDDNLIWDNAIAFMNYKYLGRKELLLSRHQDTEKLKDGHTEGYCLVNGLQRERVNTYVLECAHKNPDYIYSKQIWYIDPETWWALYSDKYDKKGKLWRVFDNAAYVAKSVYNGALVPTIGYVLTVDVKRVHGTGGFSNYVIGETGEYYDPEFYTPKALQKYGY